MIEAILDETAIRSRLAALASVCETLNSNVQALLSAGLIEEAKESQVKFKQTVNQMTWLEVSSRDGTRTQTPRQSHDTKGNDHETQ
jgi:hypothetical protein